MTLKIASIYVYYCKWLKEPHDKIALCFCDQRNWVFFFNSDPRFHGVGQLEVEANEHDGALTKTCYLDLSEVLSASASEVANAKDRHPISDALLVKVITALEQPNDMLAPTHQELALKNLREELARRKG